MKLNSNVSLGDCRYVKSQKLLTISSRRFNGSFPKIINIKSPYTGRVIAFNPIGETHPQFDYDQWDGEQMIYEPAESVRDLEILIVSHGN